MISSSKQPYKTRFAPSPTGHLHLGHAYAALYAWQEAQRNQGQFLVRIEDIDHTRCKPEFVESILDDLRWLGIRWDGPIRYQSNHLPEYQVMIENLQDRGLLYPCVCTNKDIQSAIAQSNQPIGPEGPLYPGTCRGKFASLPSAPFSMRLDMDAVHKQIQGQARDSCWHDSIRGPQVTQFNLMGDAILARKDIGVSYHIAVTHDDMTQKITHVIRGQDLFEQTSLHQILHKCMGWAAPVWHHHRVLLDEKTGKKLSKTDQSLTIESLRAAGHTSASLKTFINLQLPKIAHLS